MATTISPIKILSDLGLNPWEIENDEDYLRALKEGIITIEAATKGKGDRRSEILREELIRVRKEPKKTQVKEKKSTIKGAKLLPGTTFRPEDIKPVDVDKIEGDSPALMPDRLDNIANTVDSIALILRRQFKLETKQQRDARIKQDKDNKDAREDDLEKKPKDKKTGLIPNAIKKPALNFFEKLKTFFLNIVIGSGVAALFDWLKDPANAEKVTKFKDFLINNAGWIVGGLAAIALLPLALGLVSVVQGVLSGLALLGPLLPLLPKILAVLLIGAVAWWIGKKVTNKLQEAISGGGEFSNLDKLAKEDLEKHGLRRMRNLGSGEHSAELVGDDGKPIYVNRYGKDSLTGREWKKGDAGGPTYREELTIGNPLHEAYIKKTMGEEKLNTLKAATDRYNKTIFERKDPLKKEMGKEIRDSKKEFTDMRRAERKELGLSWKEKRKYDDETERLWAEKEDKIRLKYDKLVKKEFPEYYSNINSSATIDKDVKTNTEVPGHSTKKKGDNIILDGGKGNQQASSVGGSGTGGSSGTPKIGSQDPNNYLTVSTMAMYNMVGA
tara:strand:- start:6810 stop:8474 length:1665 start_codon:yes stop_codon:yes gene_type:complete